MRLEQLTADNQKLLEDLEQKQVEADQKKLQCMVEEKECEAQREAADVLKNECQTQLNKVLPLLKQATDALQNVNKDDLTRMKSYTSPPEAVRLVVEGLCYVFSLDANVKWKQKSPGSFEKYQDFWEYSKKYLLNEKLLKTVKNFKEENIREINVTRLSREGALSFIRRALMPRSHLLRGHWSRGHTRPRSHISRPAAPFERLWCLQAAELTPPKRAPQQARVEKLRLLLKDPQIDREKVFQASNAAGNFYLWIVAVFDTFHALKIVEPKKQQLEQAEQQFAKTSEILQQKKKNLAEILAVLQKLQKDYAKAQHEKEDLSIQYTRVKKKLTR